jgi:hypothetical protein
MHERASAAVPIILICAAQMITWEAHPDVHNGGHALVLAGEDGLRGVVKAG